MSSGYPGGCSTPLVINSFPVRTWNALFAPDPDFVDEEIEGYFEFGPNNSGSFQFGYVQGQIDYRTSIRDAKPCIEFTWDGNDESEAAQGRGWAILDENEIKGMIFFHQGDESEFKAEHKKAKRDKRGT